MYNNNVCNYIPYRNDYHSIHTINFVFETKNQEFNGLNIEAVYKVHYVCGGKGLLHLTGKTVSLSEGDIFFTFPGVPFCIESAEDFTYMYISFLGARTNMILEQLKISHKNFHFSDCKEIFAFWQNGLNRKAEISDLITESILLYTFYYIGNNFSDSDAGRKSADSVALSIKRFIDDNYSDCLLSLKTISEKLCYSPKYISSSFKKSFRIGLSDYLNTLRIQHACTLIQFGFKSVSDISNQCGYSDPQYFSKVFKKKMGQSPSEFIRKSK